MTSKHSKQTATNLNYGQIFACGTFSKTSRHFSSCTPGDGNTEDYLPAPVTQDRSPTGCTSLLSIFSKTISDAPCTCNQNTSMKFAHRPTCKSCYRVILNINLHMPWKYVPAIILVVSDDHIVQRKKGKNYTTFKINIYIYRVEFRPNHKKMKN